MITKKYEFLVCCSIVLAVCVSNCVGQIQSTLPPWVLAKAAAGEAARLMVVLEEVIEIPKMPFLTLSVPLKFEGVDYDLLYNLSKKTYDTYYDCFYWYTKCTRDRTSFHTICAYNYQHGTVFFVNRCQMDLQNCWYRTDIKPYERYWKTYQGIYGSQQKNYYNEAYYYYYIGDGLQCKYNFRRNGHVDVYNEDKQKFYEENYNRNISMLD